MTEEALDPLDSRPPTGRPRSRLIVPLAIAGLVAAVIGVGVTLDLRARARVSHSALADEPRGVTTVRAKTTAYRPTRRFVGTVEAWLAAKVGPQLVSAYVGTVLVRPGDRVKRGEVLATLDCKEASLKSSALASQARALEERQKAAASEALRTEQLSKGGFVAENDLDRQRAQVAANGAQIDALRAELAGKALAVDDCVLRAPFEGEIGARFADPGAFVRPGSGVVDVIDRHLVRLVSDAPETAVESVSPKTPVRVSLFGSGKTLEASVSRRAPSADPTTRTVRFEIDLDPSGIDVAVGTTAEISVDVGAPLETLEIPLSSAKVRGKKATLFVVEAGVAHAVVLDVEGERGGSLFVKPGRLTNGAEVVTEGRGVLRDGERVVAKATAAEVKR
jgi:RND family efflux transporter MFP subunit